MHGEFLQLGSKESEDERFAHYLKKTFMKTASLMAFTCKSVSCYCFFFISLEREDNIYSKGRFFCHSVSSVCGVGHEFIS